MATAHDDNDWDEALANPLKRVNVRELEKELAAALTRLMRAPYHATIQLLDYSPERIGVTSGLVEIRFLAWKEPSPSSEAERRSEA